jgi:DNA-binding MarR family transcriptional regulator
VDLLRADGLFKVEPNPDHQRSPLIRLTRESHDVAAITTAGNRWNATVQAAISPNDIGTTRAVPRTLIENT